MLPDTQIKWLIFIVGIVLFITGISMIFKSLISFRKRNTSPENNQAYIQTASLAQASLDDSNTRISKKVVSGWTFYFVLVFAGLMAITHSLGLLPVSPN